MTKSPAASAASDPMEAARKEAIAAYAAYWREMEKLYADPKGEGAHLDRYAASAALKNAETDATRAHGGGLIYVGDVTVTDPMVTKADISGKVPNATITSCLDISDWRTVEAKSKKPVKLPANRLTKYMVLSTVEKYPAGWRVTSDTPQGKSC
ncbi:secreted protein/lipoprotein [Streptomyces sp. NPDC048643]|uniref:secreted protein/lipoprotein n=1 Tax=Streptomyces sp. NPDC048643 TaxID=3155637 RepID=UPI003434924C